MGVADRKFTRDVSGSSTGQGPRGDAEQNAGSVRCYTGDRERSRVLRPAFCAVVLWAVEFVDGVLQHGLDVVLLGVRRRVPTVRVE